MVGALAERVKATFRRHDLIPHGGEITCLVSGGADSTCLWHVLGSLGYRVFAVHVDHGLRGAESDADAAFCAERLGAEVIAPSAPASQGSTEADLRELRYRATAGHGLRATGHTASDQVETILYRLVSSGNAKGIKAKREDGVVRPLLQIWREDTVRYCEEHGLGYRVSAVHVDHGLRGAESDADAAFCAERMAAEVIAPSAPVPQGSTEAELRELRYGATAGRGLRATGHTASDQVETILYRLVSSGNAKGIKPKREDRVVRPLLEIWREDTVHYCEEHGLDYRNDSSNASTKRGLIRDEILPLLRRLHPGAERNLLALADERPRLPRELERTLVELLASRDGTKSADLGGGVRAVREYGEVRLEGRVRFGPWRIESSRPGLVVRTRRPGDRLAGRSKKVQDLFVDAKVPRAARASWPLVVSGDDVVAVPGVAVAPGWEDTVRAWKDAAQ